MADQRELETSRRVMELLALESDLEAAMAPQPQAMHAYPEAAAAVERFHAMITGHRDALTSYLERRGEAADPPASWVRVFVDDGPPPRAVSEILRSDYTAFTYAAISYAMLVELAFRLYDPALRELSPQAPEWVHRGRPDDQPAHHHHGRQRTRRGRVGVSLRLPDVQHGRMRLCLVG